MLLQQWFRSGGGFTYSTENARGSGMRAIRDFLLENKSGYCEQFATGMALMARIAGIPSRVGIGFLPGQSGKDGQYTVRMHDMHAWPELYFQGTGWVRFEPTPAARVPSTPNWTVAASAGPDQPVDRAEHRTDLARRDQRPRDQPAEPRPQPAGRQRHPDPSTAATGGPRAGAGRSGSAPG